MANIERLRQLVRVLEKVRDENRPFNIKTWCQWNGTGKIPLLTTPANECGTASCAAGWAARDPWFRRRGFTLDNRGDVMLTRKSGFPLRFCWACQSFFKISYDEYVDLFGPRNRNSARDAIARVKRLLDVHTKAAA